jgi:hypothetical protein
MPAHSWPRASEPPAVAEAWLPSWEPRSLLEVIDRVLAQAQEAEDPVLAAAVPWPQTPATREQSSPAEIQPRRSSLPAGVLHRGPGGAAEVEPDEAE